MPVETDDGWRDWDMETTAGRWWRVRFACVTEYHSGARCLTRVRIATRATAATVLLFASAILISVAVVFIARWHPVWTLGVLFVGSVLFECLHHAAVTRAANTVVKAAAGTGFLPVGRVAEAPEPDKIS